MIGIDLPGFGGSPLTDGVRPGPRGYADWLAGWLADHDVERPHLVGSSMGGGVGLELGRRGVAASVTAFSPVGFWGTAGLRWTQSLLTGLRAAARTGAPVLNRMVGHPAGRAVLLSNMFGHPTRVPPEVARADLAGLAGSTGFASARKRLRQLHPRSRRRPGRAGRHPGHDRLGHARRRAHPPHAERPRPRGAPVRPPRRSRRVRAPAVLRRPRGLRPSWSSKRRQPRRRSDDLLCRRRSAPASAAWPP